LLFKSILLEYSSYYMSHPSPLLYKCYEFLSPKCQLYTELLNYFLIKLCVWAKSLRLPYLPKFSLKMIFAMVQLPSSNKWW